MTPRIFAINPGSTSTKLALFQGGQCLASQNVEHDKAALAGFVLAADQMAFRMEALGRAFPPGALGRLDAVVGRGGVLAPMAGGTYAVNQAMLDDLGQARYGEHASNLGAIMAWELAREHGCPAFIVDPVVTDELEDCVRLTGLPEVSRRSIFHALSQRGAARTAAGRLGVVYEEENFIVAHMGGGISIGAHRQGRVVDVINGLDGEGPFTPERAGSVPLISAIGLIEHGRYTPWQLKRIVLQQGGLFAHLGTNDLRQAQDMARSGNARAALVLEAMTVNIAKHAASLAAVLHGQGHQGVRAVVLTGGMAKSAELTKALSGRLSFLAPVLVVTGQEEMEIMAQGVALALAGRTPILEYRPGAA